MALEQLSKTGIVDGQTIQDYHITQSIDALTGTVGYDITISGSFTLDNTTGSGYFASSVTSEQIKPQSVVSDKGYTVPYLNSTGSTSPLNYNSYLTYNPVTDLLNTTSSYATSASQAISASYAPLGTPTSYNPTYLKIDDVSYTSSSPYTIDNTSPSVLYISQSNPNDQGNPNYLGLEFVPLTSQEDGKIISFNVFYQASSMEATNIFVTSSGGDIFGLNDTSIGTGGDNTLSGLTGLNNISSFDFQYVEGGGATGMAQGWYFISKEGS